MCVVLGWGVRLIVYRNVISNLSLLQLQIHIPCLLANHIRWHASLFISCCARRYPILSFSCFSSVLPHKWITTFPHPHRIFQLVNGGGNCNADGKITMFWNVKPCSLIDTDVSEERIFHFRVPFFSKSNRIFSLLHSATLQETVNVVTRL